MTTYVYETLNITSDGFTDLSINDKGQIAGDTYDGTNNHGFVYSNGSSTAVTYPGGSTSNQVFAINDSGEVVGSFVLSGATNGFSANSPYSGGGNFSPDDPGTPSSATAINTAGLIAGSFYNGTIYKAFIAAGGSFYDLNPPSNDSTSSSQFAVNSINNSDKVSGFYYNSTDATTVGFVYTYTGTNYLGGSFSTIADPNGNSVGNTYINDSGLIAGNYTNTSTFDETGFLDKNGTYTDIAPSGSTQTRVVGINNAGQVAGVYTTDGSHFYGFIYNSTNNTYATITDAGSQITELESINNEGQVVGWNASGQAFVAAPTPTIAINAIDGNNVINAAEAAAGVTISGTETSADSQTVTVKIINNANAVVDSYTTTAASGTWSVNVTKTQAQALANGSYTVTANVSDAFGNAATQATQAITVDETVPTIAANTVPEVTTTQAASGFTISGTESGADGQTVTVDILDGSGNVVATDTATASSGAWTVHVTQALTQALPADNMYEVTANVSDQYGNAASQAVTSLMMLPATPANADALDIFSVQNDPVAINDSGQLAATTDGYDTFGVLYSGGAYTAISPPGAGAQQFYELRALSINASGEVAGWSFPAGSSQQFGFIDNNGTYTTVAPAGATFSEVLAINNAGQVAGISNASNGFYFVESNGAYATFSPPAGNTTSSLSINNLGQVAGTYLAGTDKGFVYSGGQFTSISPAGSTSTLARSINDSGQVAGSYSNGTTTEGFIYSNGTYTNIFDPKGTATNVEAINNAGQVGGYYVNGSNVDVGFVYSNGTYTDIPLAGSTDTVVESINNSGQVAGYFNNGTSYEAFIASFVPATPPTVAINPVDGNNIINAAEAAAGVSIRGTESNANGQTVTVKILNSSNAVVDTYTATASSNAWSVNVTKAQAQALFDGNDTVTANVTDQYGNVASQSQAVTVHETSPSIAINPIDGNNIITTAEAAAGVTIGGTESNADGQTVTVDLLNSSSAVVDSYTATAAAGAWSVSVTAAQAQALGDGSYTVTANASDQYGNPASQAAEVVSVIPSVPGNVDEWLLSNGQWTASAEPGSHPSGYSVAGVSDFTGSGTDGILWYDASTGNTDEWKISGGAYAGSVDLGAHPGNFQIAGVGDFTGNGTDDVLWTSSSNGQVQTDIWELSGGQWAASVSPGSHPAGYQVAGIGDFTGNGTDDILWQNPTTGDVDEWQLSNGQWAASVDLGAHPGSGWQIAGVGDFTGNGISDILWTNSGNGQVQTDIWELGSNGQWVASVSPGSHPAGYQVAGIGDFTGNGTSDILWQNSTTGDIDEWQIAGGQWAASVDIGAHPGNTPVSGVGNFTGNGTSDILFHTSS